MSQQVPISKVNARPTATVRLILCAASLFAAQSLSGCGPITFTIGGGGDIEGIESTVVEKDPAGNASHRIAVIDVTGLIVNTRLPGILTVHENPVGLLHEQLEEARKDESIKAVILRLNTPGGTVTASDAMHREVVRFKKQSGKPVVAAMLDVAASGGYYLACSTDHIVAYPTTITASIGVIFQTISFKDAMERFGIRPEAITSGPNKETGSPFAEMTDSRRTVLAELVDDMYQRFRNVVRESRPGIPADRFDEVTDGRVVTGEDALALGLVDQLGDVYDAWEVAKKLAGVERADLVFLHRPGEIVGSAYAAAPAGGAANRAGSTQINLAQINLGSSSGLGGAETSFLYLWQPAMAP